VELPYQTALNLIKDLNLAGSDSDHPVNPDLMQTTWDVINLRCDICTGKRWVSCHDFGRDANLRPPCLLYHLRRNSHGDSKL
jgi:hypothetical protein